MRSWIKTIVNKFAFSSHTALILDMYALRSYLKLICEYELHSLPNKKVSGARDHGKNYMKVRPPLVSHHLRNRLLLHANYYSQSKCPLYDCEDAAEQHFKVEKNQQMITLKMADRGRSNLCVVFTMSLCALEFKQTLINLLFHVKGH